MFRLPSNRFKNFLVDCERGCQYLEAPRAPQPLSRNDSTAMFAPYELLY